MGPFSIHNSTSIKLGAKDLLRAFLGKKIRIHTIITVSDEVDVLGTEQTVNVDTLRKPKCQQMQAQAL